MCGIAGIWYFDKNRIEHQNIHAMTDSLQHRGPDGDGHWFSDDDSVQLGHRRLSIIDLSEKGSQPMLYADRYVITFNGEIYNYLEIKEILKQKGYTFVSNTDTEVVLAAYDCWGVDCLGRFDGMFAFCLYDMKNKEMFCARDRFGEKPFHYSINLGIFMFASEMKALWAAGVSRSVDDYSMYLFLNMGLHEDPIDKTRTFFTGIKRLQPGHYFILRKGEQIVQKKYWEIKLQPPRTNILFEDACEEFRELFYVSVGRRLRSDVPVGTSLSGGLDSSSVALTMYDLLGGKSVQKCFSARFDDKTVDEGYYMQKVVENRSIEHSVTWPAVENLYANIEKIMYHQEEPFASASIYAQWEVFKLSREKGVTVLLDGQGADETLAGYTYYFEPLFREVFRESGKKALMQEIASANLHNDFDRPFRLTPRFMMQARYPGAVAWSKLLKRSFAGSGSSVYINKELHDAYNRTKSPFTVFPELNQALFHSTFVSGLGKLLRFADRNAMAHSVEVRLPFLSHELVEFIFSLPANFKIHEGWTKALMRFGLQDILPPEVCWRKTKLGFQPPQKSWETDKVFTSVMSDYQQIAIAHKYINPSAPVCWEGFVTGAFIANNNQSL
jgi:asparagine synthase (glutamine-hydrolysing)